MRKEKVIYSNPSIAHDADQGYSIGSTVFNAKSGVEFVCTDSSPGAAKWRTHNVNSGWPSGTYKWPDYVTGTSDSPAQSDKLVFLPFIFDEITRIDKIAVHLVAAQPGGNVLLGLYTSKNGLPLYLQNNFSSLDLSAGPGKKEITVNLLIDQPGLYFLAALFAPVSPMPTMRRISSARFGVVCGSTGGDISSNNAGRYYVADSPYSSGLPYWAPDVIMGTDVAGAIIGLRKS